jgi:hypothetical protein
MRARATRPTTAESGLLMRARETSRQEPWLGADARNNDELLESLCPFNFLEALIVVQETGKTG